MKEIYDDHLSFTLIVETENLASCDPCEIEHLFDSLLKQTQKITEANEVIIGDNGLMPSDILARIEELIPNLKRIELKRKLNYYQAKNFLANSATGEIVIFCDSDCIYTPEWLENIIESFKIKPDANVIGGETVIDIKDAYTLAMGLNYMLHRQSSALELTETKFYFLNNAAFRREFFCQNPIPDHLKIFRGNCSVHSRWMRNQGVKIWRNAKARAYHLPPQNLRYYFLRFLLMGHDNYWLDRFLTVPLEAKVNQEEKVEKSRSELGLKEVKASSSHQRLSLNQRITRRIQYFTKQFSVYNQEYNLTKKQLLLAVPIVIFTQGLVTLGRWITQFNALFSEEPHWLYRLASLLD
ncbi:MAG TPA: glycosyl transferase family 2 [Cyanobacteria bacterium UBA8803]|nr:glycosyl transferase family 2 [Cyanobacteria bacterium UBA9273]HBL58415.1 glycosyl transferase family 2 [Cyanobacteria bacterium UBA8803]